MTTPAASLPSSKGSPVLDDLAEVIGEAAAFALAIEFVGERVYIPKDHANEPRIAEAIGAELAFKFCDAFWRTHIVFPSRIVKERLVLTLDAEGVTKREIARRVKMSERRVYEIIQRERARDTRQLDLF